jgi:hypothetical protein
MLFSAAYLMYVARLPFDTSLASLACETAVIAASTTEEIGLFIGKGQGVLFVIGIYYTMI